MSDTTDFVVDASVFLRAISLGDGHDAALRFVGELGERDVFITAPGLFRYEVVHSVRKLMFGRMLPRAAAEEAVSRIIGSISSLADDSELSTLAFEIAASHPISGYDAHYVALAVRSGLALVTADHRFADPASRLRPVIALRDDLT